MNGTTHKMIDILNRSWQGRAYYAICFLVFACSAFLFAYRSGEPPWDGGFHSYVQSEYPHNALNYLRYGYLQTRFASVMNNGQPVPPSPILYRFDHGPVTALLISVSYRILGTSDFSARLVPILLALGSVALTFVITLQLSRNRLMAFLALVFCGIMPVQTFYARLPGPHMLAVFFILLAILCYTQWLSNGSRGALMGVFIALIIGTWTDWIAYAIGPVLATHYLIMTRTSRRWWFIAALASITMLMALLYMVWAYTVGGELAMTELRKGLLFRLSTETQSTTWSLSMFLQLFIRRSVYWLTLPIAVLTLTWVALVARGIAQRSINSLRAMTIALLGVGLAHDILLRNRSINHDFIMLYHLVPACAIAAADAGTALYARLSKRGRLTSLPFASLILLGFTWQAISVFEAAHASTLEVDRATYGIGNLINRSIPETSRFLNLATRTWPIIDSAADRAYQRAANFQEFMEAVESRTADLVLVRNTGNNDPAMLEYLLTHFARRDAYGYSTFFRKETDSATPVFTQEARPIHATQIVFGGQIEFLGFDAVPVVTRPNPSSWIERYLTRSPDMLPERATTLRVTSYWRKIAEGPTPTPALLNLRFVSAWGRPYTLSRQYPGLDSLYPTLRWPIGQIVRDVYDIEIPADAPDGMYIARVGVTRADQPLLPEGERLTIGADLGVNLGSVIDIRSPMPIATTRETAAPQYRTDHEVAGFVRMSGYDLQTDGDALRIRTHWSASTDPSKEHRLLLRLRNQSAIIDRVINLPPPRLWSNTPTIVVETIFPSALQSSPYQLSLVVADFDQVEVEEPIGDVLWCGPAPKAVVLASLTASRNMPGEIRIGYSSPISIQYELREPQDVDLKIAWTGHSQNRRTMIAASTQSADGALQVLETRLVRSEQPGSMTIMIPRNRTSAGINTVVLSTPPTIESPSPFDITTLIALLQENLSSYFGWIDLDMIQIRLHQELGSSAVLTLSQSIAAIDKLQRAPSCVQPQTHQQLIATLTTQLMAADTTLLSSAEIVRVAHVVEDPLRERLYDVLRSRIEQRVDNLVYDEDKAIARILGYTMTPEDSGAGTRVDIFFEPLVQPSRDYIVYVHGHPNVGTILPAESEPYGYANWDGTPTIPTSQWKVDNIYISAHTIAANPDQYETIIGLWDPVTGQILITDAVGDIHLR